MAINLRIEALNYPNQLDPCFSITVEPVPCPPAPAIPVQESFCFFCLRERPPDGAFYGYNIENVPILRETMEEIFGPRFKLEKFSICTPCWNMVQLLDDFRTCCFEANSRVNRVKRGINGDEDDRWFTEGTVKGIEALHGTIRDQIELIKAFEEVPEPCTDNDIITIDSESDDESVHDLVIDETMVKQEHSEDPIEMILDSEQQPVQDRYEDDVEVLPEVVQPPIVIYGPEEAIEGLPEVERETAVLDRSEHDIKTLGELQLTFQDLPEENNTTKNTSTNKITQPQEQQQTTPQDQAEAVVVNSTPLSSINIKVEPEEPEDNPNIKVEPEEPEDNPNIKVEPEEPEDTPNIKVEPEDNPNSSPDNTILSSNLPEISTPNIKTEVMLPEETMETDNADQPTPKDHLDLQDTQPNLISEISVESIKVESDGVSEKIAKLVNARVNQCGRCGKSFRCLQGTHRHLQSCRHQDAAAAANAGGTVPDDVNMMYTCQICWASYRSKTNFRAHINQHAGYKPYKCRLVCRKQFFGLKGRIKHETKCNAYIGCGVCERSFTTKESLFAHIKEAHGKIAFRCEICGTSYSNKVNLRNHQRNMHREKEGGFMCRRCRKHRSKTAHEASLHLYECREFFSYSCDLCNAQVRSHSLLIAHKQKYHNEPFYGCNYCNRKFKLKFSAMKHQATHIENLGRFRCFDCPKMFDTSSSLKLHMKVHFLVRTFQCPACSKYFSSKQSLKKHFKNVCLQRSSQGEESCDLQSQADEV